MQRVIRSIFVLFSLGFFTVASAQLPPKVIADKYRIQVRQLLGKKDYIDALNMIKNILVLQKKHSLTLSPEFYFKDARKKLLKEKRYITALKVMERIIVLQKNTTLYCRTNSTSSMHRWPFQQACSRPWLMRWRSI